MKKKEQSKVDKLSITSMLITTNLRDYFAAYSLQGARASNMYGSPQQFAALAYADADAMIQHREKGGAA